MEFSRVSLDFTRALRDEERFLRRLKEQLRDGIRQLNHGAEDLRRAVYVIRMTGSVTISYRMKNSFVLYIGRGNCTSRLAGHLTNWLSDVHGFGANVGVEARIACPRRQKRPDFYKNVEADLIRKFAEVHGSIPFFNSRFETKYEGVIAEYSKTDEREMRRAIGHGSGNHPVWALKPTTSNSNFSRFMKGEHFAGDE